MVELEGHVQEKNALIGRLEEDLLSTRTVSREEPLAQNGANHSADIPPEEGAESCLAFCASCQESFFKHAINAILAPCHRFRVRTVKPSIELREVILSLHLSCQARCHVHAVLMMQ